MSGTPTYANLDPKKLKIYGDLSLSNQYVVEFELPPNLLTFLKEQDYIEKGISVNVAEHGILCSDVSLPGSTFATSEVKDNFLGVTQEFAHTRLYTDIDATFYVDKRYRILELFQGWMDFISGGSGDKVAQNSLTGGFYRRFRFPDEYKTSIQIAKIERDYGVKGKSFKSRTYNLVNAFPKSVAAIPVSYGPADILKLTVTFNYDRYTVFREDQTGSSGAGSSPQSSSQEAEGTNTTSGRPKSKIRRPLGQEIGVTQRGTILGPGQ